MLYSLKDQLDKMPDNELKTTSNSKLQEEFKWLEEVPLREASEYNTRLESLQKEFMEVFQSAAPPTPPTGSQSTKPTSTSFNPSNSEDDSAVDIEEVD